jgi:transposase-like protein
VCCNPSQIGKKQVRNHIDMPRVKRYLRNTKKIELVQLATACGNISRVARENDVQPNQIWRWRSNLAKIKASAAANIHSKTVNTGRPVEDAEVETQVFEWVDALCEEDIAVTSRQIIAMALSINPDFFGGNEVK